MEEGNITTAPLERRNTAGRRDQRRQSENFRKDGLPLLPAHRCLSPRPSLVCVAHHSSRTNDKSRSDFLSVKQRLVLENLSRLSVFAPERDALRKSSLTLDLAPLLPLLLLHSIVLWGGGEVGGKRTGGYR